MTTYFGLDDPELNHTEEPLTPSFWAGITEHTHEYPELKPGRALIDLRREKLIEIASITEGATRPIEGFYGGRNSGFETDHIQVDYFIGCRTTPCPEPNQFNEVAITNDEPEPADLTWYNPKQLRSQILEKEGQTPFLIAERPKVSKAETIQSGETYGIIGWYDYLAPMGDRIKSLETITDVFPGIENPLSAVEATTPLLKCPDLDLTLDWASDADLCNFNVGFERDPKDNSINAIVLDSDKEAEIHFKRPFRNKWDVLRAQINSPITCKKYISSHEDNPRTKPLDWQITHQRWSSFWEEIPHESYRSSQDIATLTDPWERAYIEGKLIHIGQLRSTPSTDMCTGIIEDDSGGIRVTFWGKHAEKIQNYNTGTRVHIIGETKPGYSDDSLELSTDKLEIRGINKKETKPYGTDKHWCIDIHGDTETVQEKTGYTHALSYAIAHLTNSWGGITVSGEVLQHIMVESHQFAEQGPIGDASISPTRQRCPDPNTQSKKEDTTFDIVELKYENPTTDAQIQAVPTDDPDSLTFLSLVSGLQRTQTGVTINVQNDLQETIPPRVKTQWKTNRSPEQPRTLYEFTNRKTGGAVKIVANIPGSTEHSVWGGEAVVGTEEHPDVNEDELLHGEFGILVDEPDRPAEMVASLAREDVAVQTTLTHLNAMTQHH